MNLPLHLPLALFAALALALASSFAVYGVLRKVAEVDAIPGLAVESLVLFLPALGWLAWAEAGGVGAFGHGTTTRDALLVFAGAATAAPLIGFAYAARRIPYSLVGLLQYIAPTLQLLIGVALLGEAFAPTQAVGFACIWAGLALYALDGWRRAGRAGSAAEPEHCATEVPPCDGATPPKGD